MNNDNKTIVILAAIAGLTIVLGIAAYRIPESWTAQKAINNGYIQKVEHHEGYDDDVIWVKP